MDQASGLRQWASLQAAGTSDCPDHVAETLLALTGQVTATVSDTPVRRSPPPTDAAAPPQGAGTTLLVVGLPTRQIERVRDLLAHWHGEGRRWVGDPQRWKLVPVAVEHPHLALLAEQQAHWGLWVEADPEAFRRAWWLLLVLAETRGPRQLLLMHPPGLSRRGLLDNLQQAAAHYLGIDLVVLA
ncbi:MAG: hypothetical protein R6U30_15540 [Halomonas sp.]|uniref:hypothetical protein n=1 Tax=Halomonas sp. TaxID=1486246 RepID=UPI0039710495